MRGMGARRLLRKSVGGGARVAEKMGGTEALPMLNPRLHRLPPLSPRTGKAASAGGEEKEEETAMRSMGAWRLLKIAPERRGSLRRFCCCCCWRVLPVAVAAGGGDSGGGGSGRFISLSSPCCDWEGGREGRRGGEGRFLYRSMIRRLMMLAKKYL